MATIPDTLANIIRQAGEIRQMLKDGDDLEDVRSILERVDSELCDVLEFAPLDTGEES